MILLSLLHVFLSIDIVVVPTMCLSTMPLCQVQICRAYLFKLSNTMLLACTSSVIGHKNDKVFLVISSFKQIYQFWIDRQSYTERRKSGERDKSPFAHSLSKWPQWLELRQCEAGTQDILPGFLCGCRGQRI